MRLTQRLEELLIDVRLAARQLIPRPVGSRWWQRSPWRSARRQQRHLLAGRCGADAAAAVWNPQGRPLVR